MLPSLLALVVAALTSGAVWLSRVDSPLPYPGQAHRVVDVDPAMLPADPRPMEGALAPHEVLRKAHRLFEGVVEGPESVLLSPGGNLTLLDKYGYVYEAEPAATAPNAVFPDEWVLDLPAKAYVGPGRPLGFHHDKHGNLIICDSLKGLTMLERDTGRLVVLANRVSPDDPTAPGSPIAYANDLDIAPDGTVYFSDSQAIPVGLSPDGTFYDTFRSYMLGLFAGAPTGRLLRYDPASGRTSVLAAGLWYANGVTLAHDGSYVAVSETNRLRVMRFWLAGPKAGTLDVLVDRLPGFPDGLSRSGDGNLWVALVAPVTGLTRLLKYKAMRALMAHLPLWARPPVKSWGAVLKLSPDGEPLQLLTDLDGSQVAFVSSVAEAAGRLLLGNVREDYVAYLDLKEVPPLLRQ